MKTDAKSTIETGKAILGIEFGSTRIKAVLIDPENHPIAQGSHTWEKPVGRWPLDIQYRRNMVWTARIVMPISVPM